MTERETLYSGLSRAAWGYLFLNFDINLGTVSILPRFVGFMLFLAAISRLSGERRDLALLKPLCGMLAAWNLIDWLFTWAGRSLNGMLLPLDLIISAAGLYFHFQFLTDTAALAGAYKPEGGELDKRILRRRTAYIVLLTLTILTLTLPLDFLGELRGWITGGLAVTVCTTALFVMAALFELRQYFQSEPADL